MVKNTKNSIYYIRTIYRQNFSEIPTVIKVGPSSFQTFNFEPFFIKQRKKDKTSNKSNILSNHIIYKITIISSQIEIK